MANLKKAVLYNNQKEYVIYLEINRYNFINEGKLTYFDNEVSNVVKDIKGELKDLKVVGIHIEHLKRILSEYDEDYVYMTYDSNSKYRGSVIKTIYNGFNFLEKGKTLEEVISYEVKPSRYIHRKLRKT